MKIVKNHLKKEIKMERQEAVKGSLKMRMEWEKERAEREIQRIVEKTERLVQDLKDIERNDYRYSNKEQYENMMNHIRNFTHNLPEGQGVYEYHALETADKFMKEMEG